NTHPKDQTSSGPQTRTLCRFYSQGRRCNFGKRCRFVHERSDSHLNPTTIEQGTEQDECEEGSFTNQPDRSMMVTEGDMDHKPKPPMERKVGSIARGGGPTRRTCRYFLSGSCTMEDRCRFWHPPSMPPLDDQFPPKAQHRPSKVTPAPPVTHLQEVKLGDITEEVTKELRDTEIKQMMKRFPKHQLMVQERGDGQVTFYRATVEATDPDWPFDLKEVVILVSFPDKYPLEIFTLDLPLDQGLPSVMGRHVQEASQAWLQAKHATNELMGKVELLFRPYLRWLDRSMERLFTEGARQLKKDIDVERAGLQFIRYEELQATLCEEPGPGDPDEDEEEEGGGPGHLDDGEQEQEDEDEESSRLVENIKLSEPRRGTEVKLLGLSLGDNTATVLARRITVCLQCNRCKVTADLTLGVTLPCTAQCEKCSASIGATFRPSLLHAYSDVLGYLDLHNAAPTDLVLQDCELTAGCLHCSQDGPVQNVCYGQTKELNCEHCHSKLSILAESARFQYIPPRPKDSTPNYGRKVRDPAVQKGKPLPEKGACKHYKQSHRWLRFSCCGRAYACDVCHDEDQDHLMELATRMICGYCATEQPYGNGKPCRDCGGMMTRGAHSSFWEGGLGCRNKVKMSRNDRQKYANTNKTISRKAAADKK
uniref:Nucleoporin NUP42 n=1 Tax=Gadus morhua TaxID=8049 RepID=A0A8C4Z8J2_GADMO